MLADPTDVRPAKSVKVNVPLILEYHLYVVLADSIDTPAYVGVEESPYQLEE